MFGRGDNERTLTESVPGQGATSARARLDMHVGRMTLRGGASGLMDGRFEFNEGMEPRIAYDIHDGRGELRVEQPGKPKSLNITRNRWDIRLADGLPLDLEVDNAAGEAEIDATSLALTSFELEQAAGQASVTLDGDQSRLAFVDVDLSAGKLEMWMRGAYTAMRELRAEVNAGQLRLDLSGSWTGEVEVKVEVAAGEATILLPATANVVATAKTTIGRVRVRGLEERDGAYRRDVAGASGLLRVKVESAVGQVTLEVAS